MDVWAWILVAGIVCLVAIVVWNRSWRLEEAFQGTLMLPTHSHSQTELGGVGGVGVGVGVGEPTLEWLQSEADHRSRKGNSCRAMDRFADPGLAGATIELVDPSCEGGLPHTVGLHTIRIPTSAWTTEDRRNHILRHERIHLLQRRRAADWATFYKTEWMYTVHEDPPAELATWKDRIRANPDTFPAKWACWKDRYWFVPAYKDPETPHISNTDLKIWDAQRREWLAEAPYEWRTLFCSEQGHCPYQSEHPAEISAEYAADWDSWTTPAAMSLRTFLLSQGVAV